MARYANCPCPGRWQDKMQRWVALNFAQSVLCKCLACGWKWESFRRYARKLPLHQERSRRGMTDSDVLHRLCSGNLRIDPVTAVVESNLSGSWRTLTQYIDTRGSGYRFVKVCWKGKQKKVAVHRLQWMAAHRCLVPAGYEVHHKRSPKPPKPKPNGIDNLELLTAEENRKLGHPGEAEIPF